MTEKQKGITERIKALRLDAYLTDEKLCTRGNYEWEIGIDVIHELNAIDPYGYVAIDPYGYVEVKSDETLMLMGYPVRINYENTYVIKLWMEVK